MDSAQLHQLTVMRALQRTARIAIVFHLPFRQCAELAATAYLALRIIEGAMVVAAVATLAVIIPNGAVALSAGIGPDIC